MGVNRFTDMTQEEKKRFLGGNGAMLHKEVAELKKQKQTFRSSGIPLPRNKDWRDENVVSTVKDQGQCGSW
jgi:C1A family cysteine protease